MALSLVLAAPWTGFESSLEVLRPTSIIAWSGGVGPYNVLHEWDTAASFDSGNYQSDYNTGVTSPDTGVPPGDMGGVGTTWYYRATVYDENDETNEVQSIYNDAVTVDEVQSLYNNSTTGDFTVSFDGQGPTGAIGWNGPINGVASQGTLTMDTQPTDGDTMTVDGKTYTFEDSLTNVDGHVWIGGSLANAQANIVAAFDLSGTPGTDYATAMTAHPTVDIAAFATDQAVLTAKETGTDGDSIATTSSFTAGTNQFDAATLGTTTAGVNGLKHEMEKLSNIDSVAITGSGTSGDPWLITFTGTEADLPAITTNDTGMDGSSTIGENTKGNDGGTFTLSFDGQGPTAALDYNEAAATIETELEGLSNITNVSVTGTGTSGDPWLVTFLDPGAQDVALISANDASLNGSSTIGEDTGGFDGAYQGTTITLEWYDPQAQSRFLYLVDNGGVGFKTSDEPPEGWGQVPGSTWEYDEQAASRFLYVLAYLTTDTPDPVLWDLTPNFGRPGDAFQMNGWALKPRVNHALGASYTESVGSSSSRFTDGHFTEQGLGNQAYDDPGFYDNGTNDPVIKIDLLSSMSANELLIWYRTSDAFTSVTIDASVNDSDWDNILTGGTPASMDPTSSGFAVYETWSAETDIGTYRYWRFTFTDAQQLRQIEVNRRFTAAGGETEPRLDDTLTDWLMTSSQHFYGQIVAQVPATTETAGLVRAEHVFPTPDLVSNELPFTFLEAQGALNSGVMVRLYDRDNPAELLTIATDAFGVTFTDLLSGIGSVEFHLPKASGVFDVPGSLEKYTHVQVWVNQVERFWGYIAHTTETVVSDGEREVEAIRVVGPGGLGYLSRGNTLPVGWPATTTPVWQFVDKTAGWIIDAMLSGMQSRGTLPDITRKFSATLDSSGLPWDDVFTVEFQTGTAFVQVIRQLVAFGIDIELDSNYDLRVWNKRGNDLTTQPGGPSLRVGHTIRKLEIANDFEKPANVAIVAYGDGKYLLYEDPTSTATWGRWEGFTQSSADDATSAQRLAEIAVERAGQPLDQIRISVIVDPGVIEPWIDYNLGDTIRIVSPEHDVDADYRIRGITCYAADVLQPEFILELNSVRIEKIIEHEIALSVQLQNTLPIEIASNEPAGASPREHGHLFPANADVEGTLSNPIVAGFRGVPLSETAPTDGQSYVFDSGSGLFVPTSPAVAGAFGILGTADYGPSDRDLTASGYADIPNTSVTFTPGAVGTVVVTVSLDWRFITSSWAYHGIRLLLDGSTTGVKPVEFTVMREDGGRNTEGHSSTLQFLLASLSAASHTVKVQSTDFSSGVDRRITSTVVVVLGTI